MSIDETQLWEAYVSSTTPLVQENMYADRVIHVDKSSGRAEDVFKPEDLDPELKEGGYYGPPIITALGVSVYMGETDMWIIPSNNEPEVSP